MLPVEPVRKNNTVSWGWELRLAPAKSVTVSAKHHLTCLKGNAAISGSSAPQSCHMTGHMVGQHGSPTITLREKHASVSYRCYHDNNVLQVRAKQHHSAGTTVTTLSGKKTRTTLSYRCYQNSNVIQVALPWRHFHTGKTRKALSSM